MRPANVTVPAVVALLLAAPSFAGPAQAQDAQRYRLEKSEDGYVRMDTQTGAMSLCEEKSGQLVCRMAADERSAFQDEIDRLQGSVRALDQRVSKLENSLASRLEHNLPSEEDFNRTLGYMERFLRSFMNIAKDLNGQNDGGAGKPPPDRTRGAFAGCVPEKMAFQSFACLKKASIRIILPADPGRTDGWDWGGSFCRQATASSSPTTIPCFVAP